MKKYVILVAGGSGSRMNASIPKQFMQLKGKPILYYSILAFKNAYSDIEIILVLPKEHLEKGRQIVNDFFFSSNIKITEGGETRFHSVQNGLKLVSENSIVFVHDAVRCLVSASLIHRCGEVAMQNGSAIPVISSKDSIRLMGPENTNKALDRNNVKLVQTPQVFLSNILIPAFDTPYSTLFTDEASILDSLGIELSLTDGEENNIKITHPIDLIIAENIIESRG
jgi:2-C-methyl-D-erythritol 4-phosphate cytidylyltransferase